MAVELLQGECGVSNVALGKATAGCPQCYQIGEARGNYRI
jgi:hypothetical protein